jgi:hypothetical protein
MTNITASARIEINSGDTRRLRGKQLALAGVFGHQ